MKKLFLLGCALIWMASLQAQETNNVQQTQDIMHLSLEDCIKYAETNNYSLQTTGLNVTSSKISFIQSKLSIAPSVSASASQGFSFSNYTHTAGWNGDYGVNAAMTLFNGLNNYNTIQQSKLNVEQANQELEQSKNSIRSSILKAFLTIMMNQDMLVYEQDVLKSSSEQMAQGEQQYKVGKILESDYLLLKAQYTSDLYNIENTKNTISANYLTLKNLLSVNPSQPMDIIRPDSATLFKNLAVPELQEVLTKANEYLPELKISQNDITNANYNVKLQKSAYYPDLSLSAGINTGYTRGTDNYGTQLAKNLGESVGLSLNVPIYQRSSVKNNVKLAEIKVQQAELSQKETQQQVLQDLQQCYLDLNTAYNDYTVSEVQKNAYYANFKAYSLKFQYGSVTAVDLLQQQTNYLNQLNKFMQNKYSYILQRKMMDVYMGVPVTF